MILIVNLYEKGNPLDISPPFSTFKWIYSVLRNRSFIELDDFQISKSCIKELDNIIAFFKVFFKSGPQKVVLEMVKRKFTLNDLDMLPSGLSIFLQEFLYACKMDPPGDWPFEAYILIEREDLAKLFTGYQVRGLNHTIESEEVRNGFIKRQFAEDIGSLYDSVQGVSKSKPKDIDELNLKNHTISILRFNADNRLQRLLEYLRASRPLSYEFDVPPGSR